ncbi:MAG: LD-carboxypeptidase [Bacteroidota bacterium]
MSPQPLPIVYPSRLRPGDVIGLVSPASPVLEPARIETGTRYLERNGYRVKIGTHVGKTYGYLAGTDRERTDDLHAMIRDPQVKALFCLRGGYGVPRILPALDYELFRTHPKIIVGYSDITALLLALFARSGLVTFHGPMVAVDFGGAVDPFTEQSFWDSLNGGIPGRWLPIAGPDGQGTLHGGHGSGRLLGGNLSLLSAMAGTPYLPDFHGSILFLEEIGEEPYRVDRMLNQLAQAGILTGLQAVLAGQFTECTPKDPSRPSLSIEEVLQSVSSTLGVPFLSGCRFGHIPTFLTLPVGIRAEVDADQAQIRFSESPVL